MTILELRQFLLERGSDSVFNLKSELEQLMNQNCRSDEKFRSDMEEGAVGRALTSCRVQVPCARVAPPLTVLTRHFHLRDNRAELMLLRPQSSFLLLLLFLTVFS